MFSVHAEIVPFLLHEDVHSQKLSPQRQFGTGKGRLTDERDLMRATIALIHRTRLQVAIVTMTALRANQSFWPTPVEECCCALGFSAVLFEESRQAEPF